MSKGRSPPLMIPLLKLPSLFGNVFCFKKHMLYFWLLLISIAENKQFSLYKLSTFILFFFLWHIVVMREKCNLISSPNWNGTTMPYRCEFCEKTFKARSRLECHSRKHTKPFKCKLCEKAFRIKSHLIIHLRYHTGEKPYQCEQCHKRFSVLSTLTAHRRSHSGEKPHKCDLCPKSFGTKHYLQAHRRFHTGEWK